MEQQYMIKTYEVIRPKDFPYSLIDFTFFFYNVNTHLMNFHHLDGADFIYEQERICYVFPQNEFYELLRLKNPDVPHDPKYNWLLLKGIFGGAPETEAYLNIVNPEELETEDLPVIKLDGTPFPLYRIPEHGNDIAIKVPNTTEDAYYCLELQNFSPGTSDKPLLMNVFYIGKSFGLGEMINLWFTGENKELVITEKLN